MLKTWRDFISSKQADEDHVWDHVKPVLDAVREALPAYRELPLVNPSTCRPVVVEHSSARVVWEIPLSNNRTAFMRVDRTNFNNDDQFVVFVRASDFYALWRAVEYIKDRETPNRPPELRNIPRDRKWGWQAQCWAHGKSNPVPLANVSYHPDYGIGFNDGITRTLWLLHNKAPIFPVLVRGQESALGLHETVGDSAMPCENLEQLIVEFDHSRKGED
ncbi:hypothetical protein PhaeoP23_03966 (plasmid) [Phaeobacter piscinae]|uniref:Uncharacterized protein n=1 Tax=Phaeobacter piscinae TaxID=1580596 RepID=A0ABM6PL89_9RHOB|nr:MULTISPECIES: hypothetical protein [Phaeobacter]ATG38119.1 hypothetical protein PhaeoP36_04044 [Phaeobacter piscinae]AUQ88640.1 hypothetical protein PhaeoP42_04045 [Phaeobacter piscinae]AUQ92639.1 hypothetical protein PhaeoP24_04081 [Phaeobacter inhibens]AUR26445.1 hypothetical protein PhaeoP23_03966 [Phaeobacter piscinae]